MVRIVVIERGLEMLGLKVVPPEYAAVIPYVPACRDVVKVALPPDNATGDPNLTPLTSSCTVPVATDGVTVVVNVTDRPKIIEVAFELREVILEVDTWLTV